MHTKYFWLLFGSAKIPSVSHLNSILRSDVDESDDEDDESDEEADEPDDEEDESDDEEEESDDFDSSVSTVG